MKPTLKVILFASLRVFVEAQGVNDDGLLDAPCLMGNDPCQVPSVPPDLQGVDVNQVCKEIDYATPFYESFEAYNAMYANPDAYNLTSFNPYFNVTSSSDELCVQAKSVYHLCYFCAVVRGEQRNDFCWWDVGACDKPDVVDATVNVSKTCQELQSFYDNETDLFTTDLCYQAEQASYACPIFCDKYQTYKGADTLPKRKALVWLARSSSILSLLGASFIMWDVLSKPKVRATVFHQLLTAMAIFDIVTAIAWGVSTSALPEQDDPLAGYYYQAKGTDQTCQAQAFFVQLGNTSIFYNVSLALYYVMVINYRVREQRLKKLRPLFHGLPLVVGFALAFGILPFYEWTTYGCYLSPPKELTEPSYWKATVFLLVPVGFSILCITVSMLFVYWAVRKTMRASLRWSLNSEERHKTMERQAFWQALFYAISFYITWPILFTYFAGGFSFTTWSGSDSGYAKQYILACFISFLAPLQGFNNFLVYIRPRAVKTIKKSLSSIKAAAGKRTQSTFGSERSSGAKSDDRPGRSADGPVLGGNEPEHAPTESDDDDANMDPSARIAVENDVRSHEIETNPAEPPLQDGGIELM